LVDASHPRPQQQHFRIASPERFRSHPVFSGTIKKRESFVPETIKKRLESYLGWSDLVRRRKKTPPLSKCDAAMRRDTKMYLRMRSKTDV